MENIPQGRGTKFYPFQSFVMSAWSGILKSDIMFQVEGSYVL